MNILKHIKTTLGLTARKKVKRSNSEVKYKILEAYEKMAESYNDQIDYKPHNAHYDRPNTLSLIENPSGKKIVDAACGPGKYAEILLKQGAEIIGMDLSPKMIAFAKERNANRGDFFVHDLTQPLDMIPDNSQDIVLCALALHYIEDWTATIQEFNRVLKQHGHLVISIEHPFFEYENFKSELYFEVEHVKINWNGFGKPIEVNSYRRPLFECIKPLTKNGFWIDKIIEPLPTDAFKKADPRRYNELIQFPSFLCIRGVKK